MVATGLMAALAARGTMVAPFKVGPDFIDPTYHRLATGKPGRNLDVFLSGREIVGRLFVGAAAGADIAIVEGVMGLFDGRGASGEGSTADVARLLGAPVILVVDASSMSSSVAAMVHGYRDLDRSVRVAGVVLNRVGSGHHEHILRSALEPLGVPVLGVVRRDPGLQTPERYLGLVPVAERVLEAHRSVARWRSAIERGCDIEAIVAVGRTAGPSPGAAWRPQAEMAPVTPVRIAVATGPAFSFVYPENIELLEARGAEICWFDPTGEEVLPAGVDAVYLGGGFPEVYGEELSANALLRSQVRSFASSGRPVMAECGGLLYLCRRLDGLAMCGVVDADARMTARLTLGYRIATSASRSFLFDRPTEVRAHEFHRSTVEPGAGSPAAWIIGDRREGFAPGSVHASYLHTHWAGYPEIANRLVLAAAERRAA